MQDTTKLDELAKQIHQDNVEKGFWDEPRNTGEMLMLITSELAEALEADRDTNYADLDQFEYENKSDESNDALFKENFKLYIKNSFEDEIADTVIRLLDLAAGYDIDIEKHIQYKLKFNRLREYKHGKNY